MLEIKKFIKSNKLKVVSSILILGLGFLTIFGNLYIRIYYAASMPRSPQPQAGRIFAIPALYGGTVYVNKRELDRRSFIENDLSPVYALTMILYVGMGMRMGWWRTPPIK